MTEKTKAAPGTAVAPRVPQDADEALAELTSKAKTPQERESAFLLADALKQSRLVRNVASVIAATEWGQAWSAPRQAAFARYCLALGADPLRHVDLLGGNVFVNGDYFRDVIAASPQFRRSSDPRWIHDDPRLKLCALCGQPFEDKPEHGHGLESVTKENEARLAERLARAGLRVLHNADEGSPSIGLLTLHYVDCPCDECRRNGSDGTGRGPFVGIGEVHSGKLTKWKDNQKVEVDRDPIGVQSPRATAETRAWREAGEKAEATWFRTHASAIAQLEQRVKDTYAAEKIGPAIPETRDVPPIVGEEIAVAPIAPAGEPAEVAEAPADPIERHQPNAICGIDGPHPRSACRMTRAKVKA